MSKYKGYLLKFGNVVLPLTYMAMDSGNEQTPNQREEIEAYRDDYTRKLYRITADGMITKMKIVIRELTATEIQALKNVMANSIVDAKKREYMITYWNMENMRYERGRFYIPDIVYPIRTVTSDDIKCDKFQITFIGCETSVEVDG